MKFCDFMNKTLKNQFKPLNDKLATISQFILGRKMNIFFVWYISVSKSKIIITSIREELLPTESEEHSFRRLQTLLYKNINNYELYRT